MKRIIPLLTLFLIGCGHTSEPEEEVVYVSIAPLKYVVEQIADSGTRIEVLVPETTSPESYEPTVQQIRALADAQAYVSTGLIDFERALSDKIRDIAPNTAVLDLSEEVDVLEGDCSHSRGHRHGYGIDPHIWLSPKIVGGMGDRIAELLTAYRPGSASIYKERAERFKKRIDTLDRYIRQTLSGAKRKDFAIGHTSLTYFANDYGLNQIAVETDGKEPSVKAMKQLTDSLQRMGIKAVLFQRQTSDAAARTIARELPGGRAVEFDPLAPDWMGNLYRLTDSLRVILND
ncbi:zinc ABC transporter substrate-binding protein [uncultured Rikenella sp.]|uniref:metal ABC transporter solute-binding protein, Zn/Mn family n=1 Tax=uncultured Rikenella sp. TaxID=368003 RepID=UPI00260C82FE|nr:zinc ABC transporter substrate-binding protein [uncultured Rikenella sp.]